LWGVSLMDNNHYFQPSFLGNTSVSITGIPRTIIVPFFYRTSNETTLSIQTHAPNWTCISMSPVESVEFVSTHFPQHLSLFRGRTLTENDESYLIGLMWMYVHGGMYLRDGCEITSPIDDFFYSDNQIYLIWDDDLGQPGYVSRDVFASVPHHPFWLEAIENQIHNLNPSTTHRKEVLQTYRYPHVIIPMSRMGIKYNTSFTIVDTHLSNPTKTKHKDRPRHNTDTLSDIFIATLDQYDKSDVAGISLLIGFFGTATLFTFTILLLCLCNRR
jgi:hypothetical protein